jgi:hypothetical protein
LANKMKFCEYEPRRQGIQTEGKYSVQLTSS